MPAVTLRAKPIDIKAVQYTGDNVHEINVEMLGRKAFGPVPCVREYPGDQAYPAAYQDPDITAEVWNSERKQWLPLKAHDWVLQGPLGEFYPARPEAVAAKYLAPAA
ncbi:hypothetical protein [Nocardia wallacei]|uniref:hypothetical protein n=1 Tax=Nocardia wallacei TaxID=480035 RepID=UPI0024572A73|nr:hypothetical protein [Nocardia wallacei]